MLPGIFIVLFFFALGELVGWLVNGFIPGSVIGMMLLFTALCLKWVKPERIKPVARFLCDNMALFFVPAGVGIVNALDILSQYWQAVLVAFIKFRNIHINLGDRGVSCCCMVVQKDKTENPESIVGIYTRFGIDHSLPGDFLRVV